MVLVTYDDLNFESAKRSLCGHGQVLVHGNRIEQPSRIVSMITQTSAVVGYQPMPILFNKDDHEHFDKPANNFSAAVDEPVSYQMRVRRAVLV